VQPLKFTEKQIKDLSAKLDLSHVKTRTQSGRSLSYVEGWHAIAEANRIFGYDAWNRETIAITCVAEKPRKIGKSPNERDGWGVTYTARVRITVGEVVREGVGAGHGIDVDAGLAHESAIKEAETDAMKRALMTFGNPFGLALYDKEQKDVAAAPRPLAPAQAAKIKDAITALAPMDEAEKLEWLTDATNMAMVKWLKDNARPEYADFTALGVEVA
jgi:DNA recombination protein Rad52